MASGVSWMASIWRSAAGKSSPLAVGVLRSHALDRRIWQLEGVCLQAVWQAINSTNTAENADAPENGDGDLFVLWRQVSPH